MVALVMTWGGEGSVAWAERKALVGQGGVASDRLAGGQQPSRPSAPVQKDVGISKKQRVGKGPSLEKGKRPTKEPSARRAHRRARVAKPLRPQATL
ncbi:MAG: hypothetical protein AAB072_09120, partial [Nitrospirota bacterium]